MLLATAVTALVASLSLALSTPATVSVDGQRVVADVAPVTAAGQAYLPIRAISEATGGQTTYEPATGTVVVRRGSDVLRMRLGEKRATINGQPVTMSKAPFTVRGRAMVPSAVIAQTFGSTVKYDARRLKVDVRTPGVVVAGAPDDSP